MNKKPIVWLGRLFLAGTLVIGGTDANAGCFSGDCDIAWKLNRRFDDGLRSKSRAMTEPVQKAYEEISRDLFDQRLKPLIADIDSRVAARLQDTDKLVTKAEQAILIILDEADKFTSHQVDKLRGEIIDVAVNEVRSLISDVDKLVENASCAVERNVTILRNLLEVDFPIPGLLDSCTRQQGYILGGPRYDDDIPRYRIRQCQIEREYNQSLTVRQALDNLARLSQLAVKTTCLLRLSAGADIAMTDNKRYLAAYAAWRLTVPH